MNKLVSKRLLLIIPVVLISFYIVSCMSLKKEEDPILKADDTTMKSGAGFIEPSEPCTPALPFIVNITRQLSSHGVYYIDYTEFIQQPYCEMIYGCNYIDVDKNSPSTWNCFHPATENEVYEASVIDCKYIKIVSKLENPTHSEETHSINIRIRRFENGLEYSSDWCLLTLKAKNLTYPPIYQAVPDCWISN